MFKLLLSHDKRQRLRECKEAPSRYFPPVLKPVPKHGLSATQIYPHGRNFEKSLRLGTRSDMKNFLLPSNAKVASLGTCFAEEVSAFLKKESIGIEYIDAEPNRWNFSANWGRIYTIPNLRQIFDYSFKTTDLLIEPTRNAYFDPLREHSVSRFETFNEAETKIENHRAISRSVLETADIITLTLGQNEAWTDNRTGMVWGTKPDLELIEADPQRFTVSEFTYEQNYKQLSEVLEMFANHNKSGKILITISPVPAYASFTSNSAVTASFAGKCMLRTVAERAIEENSDRCFYFPSFEMALCLNENTYRADNRHIKRKRVSKILALLRDTYFQA